MIVMFYNMDVMKKVGVDFDDIKIWDDYYKVGQKVCKVIGKLMGMVEINDFGMFLFMILQ